MGNPFFIDKLVVMTPKIGVTQPIQSIFQLKIDWNVSLQLNF